MFYLKLKPRANSLGGSTAATILILDENLDVMLSFRVVDGNLVELRQNRFVSYKTVSNSIASRKEDRLTRGKRSGNSHGDKRHEGQNGGRTHFMVVMR